MKGVTRVLSVYVVALILLGRLPTNGKADSHPYETVTPDDYMERTFGPIRLQQTLVTGVDVDRLVAALLPEFRTLATPWVTGRGVTRVYTSDQTATERMSLTVGVFADANSAEAVFLRTVWMTSTAPIAVRDVVDRAFLWTGRRTSALLLQEDNVVIHMSWFKTKEETIGIARQIAQELKMPTAFVTRATEIELPELVSVELPKRIRTGEQAQGNIVLANVDSAHVILGSDSTSVVLRAGEEPSITFCAPRTAEEAGEKTFSICVATPMNVIVTTRIRILVEKD